MSEENKIRIDNVDYPVSSLSDNAKLLVNNLQFIDIEIVRLNTLLAVSKTAATSYVESLKKELHK